MRRRHRSIELALTGVIAVLAACSSTREVGPVRPPTDPTSGTTAGGTDPTTSSDSLPASTAGTTDGSLAPSSAVPTTGDVPGLTIRGTAVAGTAGGVEPGGFPFLETDPFSEAVRLRDGTCVGWEGSRGGSTAGLAVGARIVVLAAERDAQIGNGRIRSSRWADVSDGGGQWNCFFDFTATLERPAEEFRIRVASLEPWLTRPDPTVPDRFVASVNSNADIGLIAACPDLPDPETTPTTDGRPTTTTAAPRLVSGWSAVGRYWSRGVTSLCRAGLPVTAIARPCRPEGVGSEYIIEVVDSDDSERIYDDGAEVPLGTEMTVVVATGRRCD